MPQKIVAGNWKMNLNYEQAIELARAVHAKQKPSDVRVVMFPPSLFIKSLNDVVEGSIEIGSQNFHDESSGAYTGELSIDQIKSVGGKMGLIGHSERRAFFSESVEFLKCKVDAAVANNFEFIFCCGEPLFIREEGKELDFVKSQLVSSLFQLTKEQIQGRIIAYEPVWAIGTGRTATSEQAESMHRAIRSWIAERYDLETAQSVSILYGGSCNQDNARELFSCPNVDGGLIGGASLSADSFCAIIDSF